MVERAPASAVVDLFSRESVRPESEPAVVSASKEPIRVLIVEDHAILREGLKALLEIEPDIEIMAAVGSAAEALELLSASALSVVLTDLALPEQTGIELIRRARALGSTVPFIVLTAHNTDEYIRLSLKAGAAGYVLKDAGRADLLRAIRTVVGGGQFLCSAVAERIVSGFTYGSEEGSGEVPLTAREKQVLTAIALGHSNKEVARELDLSVKTVEKHRSNFMRKLALRNTAAVTRFALSHGFLDGADPNDDQQRER